MSDLTRTAAAGKAETVEPADRPTEQTEPPESATTADAPADLEVDTEDEADEETEPAADSKDVEAEAAAADDEQTAPAEPPPPAGTSRAPAWFAYLVPGLAALLVVLLVLIAVFGYQTYAASRVDAARTEAVSSATTAAADVLSYDYRHLDKDFAKAKRHLAPGFAAQYAKTTTTVVRPSALKIKAVVSAQVIKGSVVTATKDRVVTLLFVNQTTSSTLRSGKRTDLNRVRMTMDHIDGKWLVSSVQAL